MRTNYADLNISFLFDNTAIQIITIMHEHFTRKIPLHSHGSNCFEIHYIPTGYGQLQADQTQYRIAPNTLFITGPHVEHAQQPDDQDPMQEYCIYLKVSPASARNPHTSPLLKLFCSTSFWIGHDTQHLHQLLQQLFQELEQQALGYEQQVRSILSQILVAVIRNYEQNNSHNKKNPPDKQVDQKSLIIEEYFLYEYQSLSLEALSKRLFLSARQTQRLLQEYYGKTFQEKKLEARMSAACTLLEDKSRSIASIAEALGYSSPEQFSCAFRKRYHKTPTQYRSD